MSQKVVAVKQYSQHMQDVFRDRNLRIYVADFALTSMADYILIFADGLDQNHCLLPRDPDLQQLGGSKSCKRPSCVFECVWIYGHRIDYYIFDTDQEHDSSSIIECICRSLEKLVVDFEQKGRKLPSGLMYWA